MGHDHHIYWATTTWFTSSFTHGDHAFEWTTPQRYEHQEPAGITLRETKIRDLSWGLWTSKSPFFDQNNCQFKEKGYSTYQLKWSSKKNGHRKWHTVLTNSRFFLKKKYRTQLPKVGTLKISLFRAWNFCTHLIHGTGPVGHRHT
jgi:hypothetical protein